MKIRSLALTTALVALPSAACWAQPLSGWYYSGGIGVNAMSSESGRVSTTGLSSSGKVDPGVGLALVTSIGWGFGNGFRAEGEVSYRENDASTHFGIVGASATENKVGGMFNVFYDFATVPIIQPYLGAGIGYQQDFVSAHAAVGTVTAKANGSDGSFAYQAIAGVTIPIPNLAGLSLTAEYRFMGLTGERDYPGHISVAGFGPLVAGNLTSTSNYNHSFLIGFRYSFGAAAAAYAQ